MYLFQLISNVRGQSSFRSLDHTNVHFVRVMMWKGLVPQIWCLVSIEK